MKLSELKKEIDKQKENLIKDIENLSISMDDGVKQISSSPVCFSVKFSTIAANNFILSPSYYNGNTQKKELIEVVKGSSDIFVAINKLDKVISTGKLKDGVTLNTSLKNQLQKLLEKYSF